MAERFDFSLIAEYIVGEFQRRVSDRKEIEQQWKEIDRQIKMEPDVTHKKDPRNAWMPEVELPLQAQTLEVLTADARRMFQPDSGSWFRANAQVTDDYLDEHDLSAIIDGSNDVPSHLDQDNVNKLVEGTMVHWQRQYDFWGNLDKIAGEAFKYSLGVGRARNVTKAVFNNTAKGVVKNTQQIPVLFPVSIKNTYLDTSKSYLLNEGHMIGGMTIFAKTQKIVDLQKAAKNGSKDPKNENGGWMPNKLRGLDGDKNGEVEVIEAEGDIILPKKSSGYIHIPNSIVTVIKAKKGGKDSNAVIRYRIRENHLSSYIEFPYHPEHIDNQLGGSPLMKGLPIQKAASEAMMRFLMSAQLNTQPPVRYSAEDMHLMAMGGPKLYPGAINRGLGPIDVLDIGDPNAMLQGYITLLQQYSDVTGVNAPRLGAQTVSHTTAFAKEAELSRGQVRTVDFVKSTLSGPLTQWLYTCYELGRSSHNKTSIYLDAYGGFVNVSKSLLPQKTMFEAFGAGGPLEEQAKQQQKLAALQQAMAMEQFKVMEVQGIAPTVNIQKVQEQVLRDGGWTDIDVMMNTAQPTQVETPPQAAPGTALNVLGEAIA